jgi:hypothetical protein
VSASFFSAAAAGFVAVIDSSGATVAELDLQE